MSTNHKLQDARYLWELCFPEDEASFLDFYFSRVAKAEDTYLATDERGKALAHIGILRYTTEGKKPLKLAYISGACTHPDYRGKGLMARLMKHVTEQEERLGTDALILIPASEDLRRYYRKNFSFEDTAYIREHSQDLEGYLKHLAPEGYEASSPEEFLCLTPSPQRHINFTLEQARAIIDEYVANPNCLVVSRETEGVWNALLLLRYDGERFMVDAFRGSANQLASALKTLPKDVEWQLAYDFVHRSEARKYLKAQELNSSNPPQHIGYKPWGMARPISERAMEYDWGGLGISLVHN